MRSLVGIRMGRTFFSSNFRSMKKSPVISIPVGSYWMSKSVENVSEVLTNNKLFATHASIDDSDIVERNLNMIVSAVENSARSSEEICTAHLVELCNAGNFSIAARLLQSLQGKNIFPSPDAYNVAMEAAGKVNEVEIVSRVFKDLVISCGSLPWSSFYSLANGFDSTNDNTLLLKLVEEIVELTFPRNLIVINRIIFAFGKCRQLEKALSIFYHIKDSNCRPDLVTYNTVLDILGRAGRVDEMLNEFASMKEAGIIPDFISYNTLLNNLQEAGRLDLCLVYLREMCESGIKPDLLTYTALIHSFGNSGNMEGQLGLFDDMKRNRIRPSVYIYRSLINSSKKMGKDELAKTLVKDMKASLPYLAGPREFKRKDGLKSLDRRIVHIGNYWLKLHRQEKAHAVRLTISVLMRMVMGPEHQNKAVMVCELAGKILQLEAQLEPPAQASPFYGACGHGAPCGGAVCGEPSAVRAQLGLGKCGHGDGAVCGEALAVRVRPQLGLEKWDHGEMVWCNDPMRGSLELL